ncbi:hypothetical protein JCM18237_20130 [Halorubrum luteum]
MVDDRLSDGVRIAQLLASEVDGDRTRLRRLRVTDADPDIDATADGALAYRVVRDRDEGRTKRSESTDAAETGTEIDRESDSGATADPESVAEVYVHPDRVRVEFVAAVDAVADAARDRGLRVRPKAVRPPRTLVFVEDGAEVKRILPAFEAV